MNIEQYYQRLKINRPQLPITIEYMDRNIELICNNKINIEQVITDVYKLADTVKFPDDILTFVTSHNATNRPVYEIKSAAGFMNIQMLYPQMEAYSRLSQAIGHVEHGIRELDKYVKSIREKKATTYSKVDCSHVRTVAGAAAPPRSQRRVLEEAKFRLAVEKKMEELRKEK